MAGLTLDTGALLALERRGEALAAVPDATPIDAVVMASAARRGDIVYTSDFDDLNRLRGCFPSVRVLRVEPAGAPG
jgi:predicted nuclease of predicted toxin-antitoxin system